MSLERSRLVLLFIVFFSLALEFSELVSGLVELLLTLNDLLSFNLWIGFDVCQSTKIIQQLDFYRSSRMHSLEDVDIL